MPIVFWLLREAALSMKKEGGFGRLKLIMFAPQISDPERNSEMGCS